MAFNIIIIIIVGLLRS